MTHSRRDSLPNPFRQHCSLTQVTEITWTNCRRDTLPSLVLNFVLRTSSPETFPFFPAKVALGQPDKLEAKVTHQKPVQSHKPRASPRWHIIVKAKSSLAGSLVGSWLGTFSFISFCPLLPGSSPQAVTLLI